MSFAMVRPRSGGANGEPEFRPPSRVAATELSRPCRIRRRADPRLEEIWLSKRDRARVQIGRSCVLKQRVCRVVLVVAVSPVLFASCRGRDSGASGSVSATRTSALTASAATIVSTLRARPGSPIGASVATGFASVAGGGLTPTFAASDLAAETMRADVTLPAQATGAMHLVDTTSAVAVDVTLQGAVAVAGTVVNGFVVYPGGHSSGADVLQRSVVAGSEDFLAFGSKPSSQQITYALTRGAGAAGLRLVANTVEILDASGVPRLRIAPPFIVGSDGTRTDATLAVTGCAVDTNPAGPWGRAVTPPGASTCTVKVSWPGSGVSYPAILDPRWGTVGFMGTSRYEHTLTLLSNGNVLAVGGRSSTSSTTALASAEVYNSATATWAATASLTSARRLHTATQLENGRVLAVGGLNGTTTLQTAAVYDPASGSGTWTATTGSIPSAVKNHTATLIQTSNTQVNNQVLLVGGNDGTQTIANVYLFDPTASTFSALTSLSAPRELHTAVTMPSSNGKILVAGGKNGSTVLSSALMYDPASGNGSWSSAGTMTSARMNHLMVALPQGILANGTVLVGGGSSTGSDTLSSSELFSGTATWTATSTMTGPLQLTQTVTLPNNKVMIAGGLSSSTVVKNVAYIYESSFGMDCTANSQCAGSHCVNGVCCDNACNGGCGACNLPGHVGMCTAVTSGTVCRAANGACDVAEICSGSSTTCPGNGFAASSTVCRAAADVCDQSENCPGNSANCPADAKLANGTACTDDGNPCTTDTCNGTAVACQHAAGNAGTQCRAAADVCDVAATCTGSSSTCPANSFKPSSTVCRGSAGICDVAENCTGLSAACPGDVFLPLSTVCRASAGQCDAAENCTGSSATCPADELASNGTSCSDGNSCTGPDTCQSGSCAAGPNTCAAIAVTETINFQQAKARMTAALQADDNSVTPGDVVGFIATVTNTGTSPNLNSDIDIHNTGSQTFVVGAYQQTLEYP